MAQNTYSQSLDSLPLKELNKEFIKGIKARERVVVLKQIVYQDSLIIKTYKDSIVPEMQLTVQMAEQALDETCYQLDETESKMKTYRGAFFGTLALLVLSIIF